jgi:hypothetical protein
MDGIIVPVNSSVRYDKKAVLEFGFPINLSKQISSLPIAIGWFINHYGYRVGIINGFDPVLIPFPVKPLPDLTSPVLKRYHHRFNGKMPPGWSMEISPAVIDESRRQLEQLMAERGIVVYADNSIRIDLGPNVKRIDVLQEMEVEQQWETSRYQDF